MADDPKLLGALVGSDVGLVLTTLSLSVLDVSPSTIGWIQVLGLGGMALGSSATAIFTPESEPVAMGMIIGSVAGLVAGGILGASLPSEPEPAEESPAEAAATGRRGVKLSLWNLELPTIYPTTLVAPPPAGSDGPPALLFGLEGFM